MRSEGIYTAQLALVSHFFTILLFINSSPLANNMDSSSAATSKTPKPRGRNRASEDAPKKNHLLPTPAAKRIDVESPSKPIQVQSKEGYASFVNDFNGYKCRFLCREFQFIVKFFGEQVLLTKTESLAVFAISEYHRQVCETSIQSLLAPWSTTDDVITVNPFSLDASGHFKTMFIRLSPSCTYYYKHGNMPAMECGKGGRHAQGSTFTARVAVIVN